MNRKTLKDKAAAMLWIKADIPNTPYQNHDVLYMFLFTLSSLFLFRPLLPDTKPGTC